MLVALAALFVALGGTGYAAFKVTGKNVKDSSLTGRDIKNNSVRSADVAGLLATDFKAGQLPAGPQGPKGDTGLKGDPGPQGDPGLSGYQLVNVASEFDSNSPKTAQATCPAGTKVVGGGAFVNAFGAPVAVQTSVPIDPGSGWGAEAYETAATTQNWNVHARAICARVAP